MSSWEIGNIAIFLSDWLITNSSVDSMSSSNNHLMGQLDSLWISSGSRRVTESKEIIWLWLIESLVIRCLSSLINLLDGVQSDSCGGSKVSIGLRNVFVED